jgi:hypothetical protein
MNYEYIHTFNEAPYAEEGEVVLAYVDIICHEAEPGRLWYPSGESSPPVPEEVEYVVRDWRIMDASLAEKSITIETARVLCAFPPATLTRIAIEGAKAFLRKMREES